MKRLRTRPLDAPTTETPRVDVRTLPAADTGEKTHPNAQQDWRCDRSILGR